MCTYVEHKRMFIKYNVRIFLLLKEWDFPKASPAGIKNFQKKSMGKKSTIILLDASVKADASVQR